MWVTRPQTGNLVNNHPALYVVARLSDPRARITTTDRRRLICGTEHPFVPTPVRYGFAGPADQGHTEPSVDPTSGYLFVFTDRSVRRSRSCSSVFRTDYGHSIRPQALVMITDSRAKLDSPFLRVVLKSGLVTPDSLESALAMCDPAQVAAAEPIQLATFLVRKKVLTKFQAMQLLSGKTQGFVLGKYAITEGLRQDRVGMVFRAQHTETKQEVALKVLPTDRVMDNTIFQSFLEEAQRAVRVNNPAVARVFEVGQCGGTHYVVCELVEAPTLDKVVAARGPLEATVAAQVIAQAAVALLSGHAEGLLHRDIKPANIALLPDNQVKLLDFGLAHMVDNPWANQTKRINLKEYAEEIAHIAPEQAWGSELDARSDIYSLGSTAYFLLTGQCPFAASATESMTARQVQDIPKASDFDPQIPAELDEIVQQMGAKDPDRRFQSAEELVAALLPWLPVEYRSRFGVESVRRTPTRAQPAREPKPEGARPGSGGWLRALFRRLFGR
jgi:hypothetical protein